MHNKRLILIFCLALVLLFVTSNYPERLKPDPRGPVCLDVVFAEDIHNITVWQRGFPFPSFQSSYLRDSCGINQITFGQWLGFGFNAIFWLVIVWIASRGFPEFFYKRSIYAAIIVISAIISLLGIIGINFFYYYMMT